MTRPYIGQRVRYIPKVPVVGADVVEAEVVSIDRFTGAVDLKLYLPVIKAVQFAQEPTYGYWSAVEEEAEGKAAA